MRFTLATMSPLEIRNRFKAISIFWLPHMAAKATQCSDNSQQTKSVHIFCISCDSCIDEYNIWRKYCIRMSVITDDFFSPGVCYPKLTCDLSCSSFQCELCSYPFKDFICHIKQVDYSTVKYNVYHYLSVLFIYGTLCRVRRRCSQPSHFQAMNWQQEWDQ